MEKGAIVKQVIEFQKAIFNNSMDSATLFQDQTELFVNKLYTNIPGIPELGKTIVNESMKTYKKNCEDFKVAVNDGFTKVESLMLI